MPSFRHYVLVWSFFFFFNDTATTEIYTLSLHDALPICLSRPGARAPGRRSANRTGGGFLRRLRESCGRQPACARALRPLKSPQDRSGLQVLRARAEIRVRHRPAAARPVAFDERTAMIAILDYGAGNLRSVENTLAEIGAAYTLVRDAAGLRHARKIILPGVGHFGQMMRALDEMRVRDTLLERIRAGIPFLGICLGLQALFERSEEAPEARGLGLYEGTVRRFPAGARVPHMGW